MDKKVLFLTDTRSFLVNTIVKGIEDAGYFVELMDARASSLKRTMTLPQIVILYFQQSPGDLTDLIESLGARVNTHGMRLYIMGDQQELPFVYDYIGMEKFSGIFYRPVNVKEVVAKLNLDAKENETQETNRKRRILIVDDNPTTLRMMNRLFTPEYDVTMASSGMNAITFLANNQVDLILLDIEMPIVDGTQVFEMLQSDERTKNIPVMFLTGKSDRESVTKATSLLPVRYLLKTMPPEDLFSAVREFFDMQRDKVLLTL